MPHFIIDCSENLLEQTKPEEILQTVYTAAEESGLFAKGDIKVRIRPFNQYRLGPGKTEFLHVFANIMEGRTTEQKADLSRRMIENLDSLLPGISILSMNIREFEKATYCNKQQVGSRQ